jgi:5-methyltetrahydrofolate--homocysteine methyltransferase
MHTTLSSATKQVTIGHDQPFCIIGERINPTGRRIFQEQLRAGDLSAIERDVAAQVAGGAMVLDVNMGVPLTDEPELLQKAIKLVQSLSDLPICIDSSVVEALEAGLSVYEGRALVNSVTAEGDGRGNRSNRRPRRPQKPGKRGWHHGKSVRSGCSGSRMRPNSPFTHLVRTPVSR